MAGMSIEEPSSPNRELDEPLEVEEVERMGFSAFPIVGIGASAGGLEAYRQFLSELPEKTGMAYVLIQHLDPKHESRLTDVLEKSSRLPIHEVTHATRVEPDHVYVIPPDSTMTIERGTLLVVRRGERTPHLVVDAFFRSLARDSQSRAIGVVLSGTGSDGTLGMLEIKAVGGITYAQDEASAKYNGMPQSAIEAGCVDFVLPPNEIARSIARIKSHPYLSAPETETVTLPAEDEFQRVLSIVRKTTGVDFSNYRDTTIKRRIQRRMMLHGKNNLIEYADLLLQDRSEIEALYRDLLINVTGFFRDPDVFEALKHAAFPEILHGKSVATPIRIWVPGCSTGQEAYSIAIALLEFLDDKPFRPTIQVFATDLSDSVALERARTGIYPENIEGEVSPERLRRFFKREDHVYRIDKSIRDMCVFARQNIAADPPFSHVDLISCRNVLIYMSQVLQRRVMPTFHYALNSPGYLLLGSSESVGPYTELFELVDRSAKIYVKKQVPSRFYPHFLSEDVPGVPLTAGRGLNPIAGQADFQKEADRILLGRFSPPAVLVDDNMNILQFRGKTSDFLEPPTGEPSTNLLKMAREGLFLELRTTFREAKKQHRPVRREGVRIQHAHHVVTVNIEVVPISLAGTADARYLVLFEETRAARKGPPLAEETAAGGDPHPAPEPPADLRDVDGDSDMASSSEELGRVRQELSATKDYLQSLLEQQDAVNEELRSANEEILSSNEELQSTNEELETAKEELQSTNEELTTVNEQLHHRNLELSQVNNDLTNLLSSTMIPVVMVGGDMRIRRFTPPARRTMNLLPTDVGRPISDIKPKVEVPDLDQIIVDVIETVRPVEREVMDRDGKWFGLRVYPYRTTDNKIDGAVIVLLDIDQAKRNQEDLEAQSADLRTQASLVEHSTDAIIVMDGTRHIRNWNRGAEEMYGYTRAEAQGKVTHEFLKTGGPPVSKVDAELERTGTWVGELRHTRKDRAEIVVQSCQVLVRSPEGKPEAVLEINRDITDRLRDEAMLRRQAEAQRQADRRKDEFLAMLAHELRNPLAPVKNAVRVLRLSEGNEELMLQARDVLERQVEQLSRIVDDLLDMTRIAEGKIELRKERVKLSAIVQTAVESSRSIIESRGHKLAIHFPAKPLYLEADPARLAQVVTNLLNNAAKFTDERGEIVLTIERETGARNSAGTVSISVRDSGIGIAPEMQPQVFEMFYQGDQSLERVRGGLGVGLTLVKSLVRAHGGTVEVKSDGVGRGSEFLVHLPLTSPPPATREEPAPKAAKKRRTPRRVLVVDDNRDQAESLGMLLEIFGHQVRIAFDGNQALEIAQDFKPQMVLLDIGLPGMSGYELARRIREVPALEKTVLVAQTGWGEEADRQRSAEAGIDRHLVKPVDIQVVEEILEAIKG
jgi:two-component system CheB/CheR fusion protein